MSQNLIMEIPPEILANILECAVLSSPRYTCILPSLSLVCRHWRTIISTTPGLWGIFRIHRRSRIKALDIQMANAKSAMLDVGVMPDCIGEPLSHLGAVMRRLLQRSENFVSLTAGTDAFVLDSNWGDFEALKYLELYVWAAYPGDPKSFFSDLEYEYTPSPSVLETFIAHHFSDPWTRGFLSPSIRHIHLFGEEPHPKTGIENKWDIEEEEVYDHRIQDTFDYLHMVPRLVTLKLKSVKHTSPGQGHIPSIVLENLEFITLDHVLQPSAVLSAIHAPSLKELTVNQDDPYDWPFQDTPPPDEALSFSDVFMQWSQPGAVPTSLRTLELIRVLKLPDIPFLIRWLAHLPNLTHLTLKGNIVGHAARAPPDLDVSGETNLFRALASPTWGAASDSTTGWLCPSLTHLYLDVDEEVNDLLPIARARGGNLKPSEAPYGVDVTPPARLCTIEANTLCTTGTWDEQQLLLSLVDDISCACIACCVGYLEG